MEKTIEIKAIDKEKAIKRALNILEINPTENEEVIVKELKKPKKKLFGLLGIEQGLYEICIRTKIKTQTQSKKINKPAEIKKSKEEVNVSKNKLDEKEKSKIIEKKSENHAEKLEKKDIENEILKKADYILKNMNLDFEMQIKKIKDRKYLLELFGKDNAIIIGQKGKTLNSFEYILNSVVKDYRIEVDVENFKEKRNETLRSLAKKMAEKVLRTGKTVRLNAMPPRERKVIHEIVNKYEGLDTYSEGRDPKRYIVIKKKK